MLGCQARGLDCVLVNINASRAETTRADHVDKYGTQIIWSFNNHSVELCRCPSPFLESWESHLSSWLAARAGFDNVVLSFFTLTAILAQEDWCARQSACFKVPLEGQRIL